MTEPRHVPTPAEAAPPAPYERTRWESAVFARQLHHRETVVALILSHYAGPGGILPQDGIQRSERMRATTRIGSEAIRQALSALERHGLIFRQPYTPEVSRRVSRAIVLTIPVRRERPPHTGDRP
ncbi:hypothetical protein QA860_07415 [Streptomyces stelliscabiei]|uniref:hypothetical protein n=1 Tax=Streptomyces stelliscabiei TaxID=146820 RepID=UPI002FF172A5